MTQSDTVVLDKYRSFYLSQIWAQRRLKENHIVAIIPKFLLFCRLSKVNFIAVSLILAIPNCCNKTGCLWTLNAPCLLHSFPYSSDKKNLFGPAAPLLQNFSLTGFFESLTLTFNFVTHNNTPSFSLEIRRWCPLLDDGIFLIWCLLFIHVFIWSFSRSADWLFMIRVARVVKRPIFFFFFGLVDDWLFELLNVPFRSSALAN